MTDFLNTYDNLVQGEDIGLQIGPARLEAERRYPFLKRFNNVKIGPAIGDNKGGLGEFHLPGEMGNPVNAPFISIGPNSQNLPGGVADTIVADMVHAAGQFSPEFKKLKKSLRENLSEAELSLARRRYEDDFKGKFTGSNFSTFENFLDSYWLEGVVQDLLIPEGPKGPSEIDGFRNANPKAKEVLDKILGLFKGE